MIILSHVLFYFRNQESKDWALGGSLNFLCQCLMQNGNPLQCSCLENPMDGEAWQAVVHGVTQSRTQLKRLSSSSSNAKRMHIRRNLFTHLSVTQQMYFSICNNQIGHTLIVANNSRCHRNRMFIRCVKHFNLGVAYFNLHRKVWPQSIDFLCFNTYQFQSTVLVVKLNGMARSN